MSVIQQFTCQQLNINSIPVPGMIYFNDLIKEV